MAEMKWKDNMSVADQVEYYKEQLAKTDYQILKCVECHLCGEELPYDIETLHHNKNELRDMIDNLENIAKQTND